jgi:hypothetical protein
MTPTLQTFDGRQPTVVDNPGQIKPGDWYPDLGTLRQVETVDTIGSSAESPEVVFILHFVHQRGIKDLVRGISGDATGITVWRDLPAERTGAATQDPHRSDPPFQRWATPAPAGG